MQIELYKFSKRINSTKRPVAGSGFTTQCTIKQNAPYVGKFGSSSDTTVCYPVLFLTGVDNPNAYNYVKAFGDRYYFIRDIQVDLDGAATLHCEIDVLATRKTEILASTQFVLYSASNYDLQIDDARHTFLNDLAQESTTVPLAWTLNQNDPYFIVSGISSGRPMPAVYYMDSVEIADLVTWLTDPANLTFLDELRNFVFDPASAILSIRMTSLDTGIAAQSVQVTLGQIGTTATGKLLHYGDVRYQRHHVPTLGTGGRLDYTYGPACSQYFIELPFCGIFELPADEIYMYAKDDGDLTLSVDYYISAVTGDIVGFVYLGSGTRKILSFSGSCYAEVPWGAQGDVNIASLKAMANATIGAVTFGATGYSSMPVSTFFTGQGIKSSYVLGRVGAEQSVGNIANEFTSGIGATAGITHRSQAGSLNGYMGGQPNYFQDIKFIRKYRQPIGSLTEERILLGMPCNRALQLSSLNGFCQCKNPSIVIDDLKIIAELINRYLSGGFFIE